MPLEMPEDATRGWLRRAIGSCVERASPIREDAVEACLAWARGEGHHVVTIDDPRYPPLLREIADPPAVLFARGRLELLQAEAIAIVGSRNATPRGLQDAREFAEGLSRLGLCVVSGMARGIDAAAHAGGLAGEGSSIAVLGTGPDQVYPRGNAALERQLASRGCIVTEFPVGTPPLPHHFPRRNRVISGICRGVLVIEAASRSGSLVTARIAAQQGRDVFALPGSIHATLSKGCHELIRDGAKLVEHIEHVVEDCSAWRGRVKLEGKARDEPPTASDPLLDAIGFAPVTLDAVARLSGLDAAASAARLVRLELLGLVRRLAGGLYQRSR